jgi:Rha family phage regulatory protein
MNEQLVLKGKSGRDITTSLIVAGVFGKEHKNVLRDISELSCSEEFNRLNFELISYPDSKNREQKAYEMTKDGFLFLVMGYTGDKAGAYKELFIKAFNINASLLQSDDYILSRALEISARKMKALETQLNQKTEQLKLTEEIVKENAPKVEYYQEVLTSESLITATVIAKDLGMSATRLDRILKTHGVIYKVGETWVLKRKYQDRGYTHTKTFTHTNSKEKVVSTIHTYWTEKGRQFIMDGIKKLKLQGKF